MCITELCNYDGEQLQISCTNSMQGVKMACRFHRRCPEEMAVWANADTDEVISLRMLRYKESLE